MRFARFFGPISASQPSPGQGFKYNCETAWGGWAQHFTC